MQQQENKGSLLIGGVPADRWHGRPKHIENDSNFSAVAMRNDTKKIAAVHTPKNGVFESVHEIMHSRHTDLDQFKATYAGVCDEVAQITEDCRIHLNFWPWRKGQTPAAIEIATKKYMRGEIRDMDKMREAEPNKRGGWPDFCVRMRYDAVHRGLGGKVKNPGFADYKQRCFSNQILHLIHTGYARRAALMLQTAFFPPPPAMKAGNGSEGLRGEKGAHGGDGTDLDMKIIRLPLTEVVEQAQIGYRRATSGSRLHRPSLGKPVLPQKLFMKRVPNEPAGTILIDASGSMGDFDQIEKWLEKAPFGQVAYYAGGGSNQGWLYVYAKDGRRAQAIERPPGGGNTVDGPALDWLLQQPKPRVIVTDREFCGASDSDAQVMRLAMLERMGEVKVEDYSR